MSSLHVVYRLDDPSTAAEQWSAYSYPTSIYAAGSTLDEARSAFRDAARFTFGDQWSGEDIVEHLERPLIPGAYMRTAVDRRMLDRDQVATAMRDSLALPEQREDFTHRLPTAATGDAVVIACVAGDRFAWVFEQMSDDDAVAVCATGPAIGNQQIVWWSFLVGGGASAPDGEPTETLAAAGLSAESTIGDFSRTTRTATGRALATA